MTLKEFVRLNTGDKVRVFGKDCGMVSQRFNNDVWVKWDDSVKSYGWNDAVSTRFNICEEDAALFELVS